MHKNSAHTRLFKPTMGIFSTLIMMGIGSAHPAHAMLKQMTSLSGALKAYASRAIPNINTAPTISQSTAKRAKQLLLTAPKQPLLLTAPAFKNSPASYMHFKNLQADMLRTLPNRYGTYIAHELTQYAQRRYGLHCAYPVFVISQNVVPNSPWIDLDDIWSSHIEDDTHIDEDDTIKTTKKYVVLNYDYMRANKYRPIEKAISELFLAQEYLKKDHRLQRLLLMHRHKEATKGKEIIINYVSSEKDFELSYKKLCRTQAEEADASMKDHADLCDIKLLECFRWWHADYHSTVNIPVYTPVDYPRFDEICTEEEMQQFQDEIFLTGDMKIRERFEKHLIKPLFASRAFYFKKWIAEAEAKKSDKNASGDQ